MNINKVVLTGNLVKEPEMMNLQSGKIKCSFRIAVGGFGDRTDFFPITTFGTTAENCGKYLHKGSRVALDGRLSTREYEKDGQKRTITEIIADNVEFLSARLAEDKEEAAKPQEFKQEKMGGLPPIDPVDDDDVPW